MNKSREQRIQHLQARARDWRHRQYDHTYSLKQQPNYQPRIYITEVVMFVLMLALGMAIAATIVQR